MEILNQRFQYAVIKVCKDYCNIQDRYLMSKRMVKHETKNYDFDDIFGENTISLLNEVKKDPIPFRNIVTDITFFKKKNNRKTNHYHLDNNEPREHNNVPFISFYGDDGEQFYTTKDKHIKKHYGRPLSSIIIVTIERTVVVDNGKLVIKAKKFTKYRGVNKIYFKRKFHSETLTFDLSTGNFTIGETNVISNSRSTRFRKNSFAFVERLITSNGFFNFINSVNKNLKIYPEFCKTINDTQFIQSILEEMGQLNSWLPNITENEGRNDLLKRFIDFFVKTKKIKVPNDYMSLIRFHYPGQKYLKRNDNKLLLSVLDSYGIKSKFTNKLFHTNTNMDIFEIRNFASFFGSEYSKYMGNLDEKVLKFFDKKEKNVYQSPIPINARKVSEQHDLEQSEKENIIKIINSLVKGGNEAPLRAVSGLYSLFRDHVDMIKKLKEYDPTYRLRSTTYEEFHTEHLELTKLISTIRKGWSKEYVYDNRTVRKIETPIIYEFNNEIYEFHPTILKREEEYSEEGSFMHHCVASYANKETSMIVSIRLNNGMDRVTCEYEKKTGHVTQERHFCNRIPPEHFNKALSVVSDRIKSLRYSRLLDHIDVKKVRVKINGKEVPIPQAGGGTAFLENDPFGF
jgi:hypothetical protein